MQRNLAFRPGFTLIELVVVVMIIAILGAVAVPRLLTTRQSAQDIGLIRTLAAVRNAIDLYSFENSGELPGSRGTKDAAQFKQDVENYLQGPFPKCPVGAAAGREANVLMSTVQPFVGTASADEGWAFNTNSGDFIVNFDGPTQVDANRNYDEL